MARQDSVRAFAARVSATAQIKAVLLNTGIYTHDIVIEDADESTLTVNVINTFWHAVLLIPLLRKSEQLHLSFLASDRHVKYALPEWTQRGTF